MLSGSWTLETHGSGLLGLPVSRGLLLGLEMTLFYRLADWSFMRPWEQRRAASLLTWMYVLPPVHHEDTEIKPMLYFSCSVLVSITKTIKKHCRIQ